jgi:hypothetical protein
VAVRILADQCGWEGLDIPSQPRGDSALRLHRYTEPTTLSMRAAGPMNKKLHLTPPDALPEDLEKVPDQRPRQALTAPVLEGILV